MSADSVLVSAAQALARSGPRAFAGERVLVGRHVRTFAPALAGATVPATAPMPAPVTSPGGRGHRGATRATAAQGSDAQAETAVVVASTQAVEDRRAGDGLSLLSRSHDALVTTAIHPWEIAAGLEAAGVTDAVAASRYGRLDVFDLADQLYARVPRRYSNGPRAELGRRPQVQAALHGVLYAVPILLAIAVAPLVGSDGQVLLLASLVYGWSWTQAMTSLGHRRLGLGDTAGARRVLGGAAACGVLLWVGVALLAVLAGTGTAAVSVSSAQVLYFFASGVVVVLGGEVALLLVLVPGTGAALAHLVVPGVIPAGWLAAGLLSSVAGALVLAVLLVRRREGAEGLTWSEARTAAPYALHGGALALFLVAGMHLRPGSGAATVADTAAIPVVLSMAIGEELLRRYRSRISGLLDVVVREEDFRPRARRALARVLVLFLGTIAGATVTLHIAQSALGHLPAEAVLFGTAYGALGAAMFGAVLLSALGEVEAAAWVSVPAALLLWGTLAGHETATPQRLTVLYTAFCITLLVVMTAVALARVGRVWVHR